MSFVPALPFCDISVGNASDGPIRTSNILRDAMLAVSWDSGFLWMALQLVFPFYVSFPVSLERSLYCCVV